jgi:hypothetical protein
MLSTTRGSALTLCCGHAQRTANRPAASAVPFLAVRGPAPQIRSALCRDGSRRIKFNLMGAGGLRTYISFTRIGDQPSR